MSLHFQARYYSFSNLKRDCPGLKIIIIICRPGLLCCHHSVHPLSEVAQGVAEMLEGQVHDQGGGGYGHAEHGQ